MICCQGLAARSRTCQATPRPVDVEKEISCRRLLRPEVSFWVPDRAASRPDKFAFECFPDIAVAAISATCLSAILILSRVAQPPLPPSVADITTGVNCIVATMCDMAELVFSVHGGRG